MATIPVDVRRVHLPVRKFVLWGRVSTSLFNGQLVRVDWQCVHVSCEHIGPLSLALIQYLFRSAFVPGVSGVIIEEDHAYRYYGRSYRPLRDWREPV